MPHEVEERGKNTGSRKLGERTIMVNGDPFALRPLDESGLVPGAFFSREGRRLVYRIVCEDGTDLIVRNVRHERIVEAIARDLVLRNCKMAVPV